MLRFKTSLTVSLSLIHVVAFAQQEVEMADTMRSNGKIFVVVGIVLIVLGGLVAYLFTMDRKIKKLENQISEKRGKTN